jgi:hypothetical protein
MKKLVCIACICVFALACSKENKTDNRFRDYLNMIPEIQLPFNTNSYEELTGKVEMNDTLFKDFTIDAQGILGKLNINDSITGIIYLYGGNTIYPELITYNQKGQQIAEQQLVTLTAGPDALNSSGSSYMSLTKDFKINITDTIQSYEKDSLGIAIDSTWEVEVVNYKYNIEPNGKITEIK